MRRIVSLVLVSAAAVGTAAVALASSSPKAVRASIVVAALAQKSVHWTSTSNGHGTVTRTADVNADSGTEQATFDGAAVQIRLVDDTAYVQGDVVGLQLSLYLTQAQATQYAGQWISIPKGDELYAQTADGLTLASIVHDATPQGKLKLVSTKAHGTRLLVVRGRRGKQIGLTRSSLAAHASGTLLPVTFSNGGVDHSLRGLFSKWNEPGSVQAPSSSTPIATVRAG